MSASGAGMVSGRAFNEAATWLDYARKPVGTGPYRIREYKADTSLTMDAHDEYWGGRHAGEDAAAGGGAGGFLAGERIAGRRIPVRLRPCRPTRSAPSRRTRPSRCRAAPSRTTASPTFDKNHAPLRDPRVRQAMTHAIDRQAIVDSLWPGAPGVPAGLQWEFTATCSSPTGSARVHPAPGAGRAAGRGSCRRW